MLIRYPLLLPVIGHGATDIVDRPIDTITIHMLTALFVYFLKEKDRRIILILASIIHISKDIPSKNRVLISIGLHKLWLYRPIVAKLYLLLYHMPLHYLKNYIVSSKNSFRLKTIFSITTNILSFFALKNNVDIKIEKKMGKYWWTAPVLGHILVNDKINKINDNRYKNNFIFFKNLYYL